MAEFHSHYCPGCGNYTYHADETCEAERHCLCEWCEAELADVDAGA
jgi:hypothetical protein